MTKAIPASLTAIIFVTLACIVGSKMELFEYRSVLDYVQILDPNMNSLSAALPKFHLPAVPFDMANAKDNTAVLIYSCRCWPD